MASRPAICVVLAVAVLAIVGGQLAERLSAADAAGAAKDWSQWRGPARDGISAETDWLTQWPQGGPKVLWKANVGSGFGAVAVAGGRLYTMGNTGKNDVVWCLNADTGKLIWKDTYPCKKGGYPGPRATPAVVDGRVYTLSRQGHARCYDAATGQVVWKKDLAQELKLKVPGWGIAGSPLVDGNLVIYNVGNAGAAVDKATGRVVWQTGGGKSGYGSPIAYDMNGKRCVLVFAGRGLSCRDIKTGQSLWQVPWKTSHDVNAADPIVVGDKIFITSGYGSGCALLKVAGGKATIVWRGKQMASQFSSCVLYKGHLYGVHGNTGMREMTGKAVVRCIELATGKVKWSSERIYMGALMLAGDKLIIQGDGGWLSVAEASPDGLKVISRAKVLDGMCWTMPVLAGGRIYCRNNKRGELVCLDVRAR